MKPHLLVIISILFPLLFFTGKPDLAADRSALLTLRSAVGGRSLLWNLSSASPCSWTGVFCHSGRVTELHLPGMGLSGSLPPKVFSNLTRLNTLSLRFNALSGPIPADLGVDTDLRNLYLQHNLFSGDIPDSIFSLPNLVRINLASNKLSGTISPRFNNLTRLATLYLENNNLTGQIPVLDQPSLGQFNVSSNQLTGPIPVQLAGKQASAFAGNSLCGKPLESCNGTDSNHSKKKNLSAGAIAGIIIGSALGFLLIIALLICCCMRKGKSESGPREATPVKQTEIETPVEKAGGDGTRAVAPAPAPDRKAESPGLGGDKKLVFFGKMERGFDLEDLLRASAEVLGKGTFGTAYKAVLEAGTVVAVKRLKDVTLSEREFRERIEGVGRMGDHENLVPLRAYYYSRDEKLLVHDFMPMGSLSALLHGNRGTSGTPLNWETRSLIALGAARGLTYLHSQGPTVSHGNVKSSNVLLTKSYEARVSDFGLNQLAGPTPTPNRVEGYRAPEVTDPRKVTQKADVYSFGVLLLELLTGKAPTHAVLNEEGVDLPRWVQSVVREQWTNDVFDPELLRYQNVEEEMVELLQLANDCVAQYPDSRPSMSDVTSRIGALCRSSIEREHGPAGDTIQDESGSGALTSSDNSK